MFIREQTCVALRTRIYVDVCVAVCTGVCVCTRAAACACGHKRVSLEP